VIDRRLELGLSQQQVQDSGGPSTTKLREIENHRTEVLSRALRRGLERALHWVPGSVDRVLAGELPQSIPGAAAGPDWRRAIVSDDIVRRVARRRAADLLEDWAAADVRERFLSQARAYLTLAVEEFSTPTQSAAD
jgi:hypothetical protein